MLYIDYLTHDTTESVTCKLLGLAIVDLSWGRHDFLGVLNAAVYR